MYEIIENQELDKKQLLSFHGKLKQEEIPATILQMKSYAEENGAKVVGGPISVTYAVEQTAEGLVTDVELLLTVDKEVTASGEFMWKERVLVTNAVMLSYKGNQAEFFGACNEMNTYIQERKYTPITAGYVVTKGGDQFSGMMDMEVYVGISPNIL